MPCGRGRARELPYSVSELPVEVDGRWECGAARSTLAKSDIFLPTSREDIVWSQIESFSSPHEDAVQIVEDKKD